jgi:hypothetical protein
MVGETPTQARACVSEAVPTLPAQIIHSAFYSETEAVPCPFRLD